MVYNFLLGTKNQGEFLSPTPSKAVTILVCMKKAGISKLVTHDQDFKKITEIEVIDPLM